MKRNKGVDIFRAFAILAVLVYHFYVLAGGNRYADNPVIHRLISMGGEVGVTLFFIISGYGIYLSIDYKMKRNAFDIKEFFTKRVLRILPQYYVSLLAIMLLTSQATVLSRQGAFDVFTHMFLIHNFFPSTCGSISTVLWTMGVIFQFYLIAVLLYKLMKKSPVVFLIVSIVFTVLCKVVLFHLIFPRIETEPSYFFIYGRQLFTALDNFVVGMFLASVSQKEVSSKFRYLCMVISTLLSIGWIVIPDSSLIYTDSVIGYSWHSILAVLLGILMWSFSGIDFKEKNIIMRMILFISKYQYGIYLWHFVVASNLMQNSSLVMSVSNRSFIALTVGLLTVCIVTGYMSTIMIEAPEYGRIFKRGVKKSE